MSDQSTVWLRREYRCILIATNRVYQVALMTEEESGLDELMRLSRQFTKQQEDNNKAERERIEKGKKVKGVLDGLKALNIDMSLTQLKGMADGDTIKRVEKLKTAKDAEDLRKLITSMANDMERSLSKLAFNTPEADDLATTQRTFTILLDLYFSLQ